MIYWHCYSPFGPNKYIKLNKDHDLQVFTSKLDERCTKPIPQDKNSGLIGKKNSAIVCNSAITFIKLSV